MRQQGSYNMVLLLAVTTLGALALWGVILFIEGCSADTESMRIAIQRAEQQASLEHYRKLQAQMEHVSTHAISDTALMNVYIRTTCTHVYVLEEIRHFSETDIRIYGKHGRYVWQQTVHPIPVPSTLRDGE